MVTQSQSQFIAKPVISTYITNLSGLHQGGSSESSESFCISCVQSAPVGERGERTERGQYQLLLLLPQDWLWAHHFSGEALSGWLAQASSCLLCLSIPVRFPRARHLICDYLLFGLFSVSLLMPKLHGCRNPICVLLAAHPKNQYSAWHIVDVQ